MGRTALAFGLGGAIAWLGWRKSALSTSGAIAATAVGASTFAFGGLPASLALIVFFVTGSALSRRNRVDGELESEKGHRRDAAQVLANGGIAALALALGAGGTGGPARAAARGAALGALATAAADTWASEIGVRSPVPPRSIVTGAVVRPGASGGVTPLGWAAAGAGAVAVGAAWTLAEDRRPSRVLVALVAGLVGSLADSLAGATWQASYFCETCGETFEAPGEHCRWPLRLERGVPWITNDVVNGIGTAAGALVGAALSR
jgi:uncharacterized protein (TIGR00297 family)